MTTPLVTCARCEGSGEVRNYAGDPDAGDLRACPECAGRGTVRTEGATPIKREPGPSAPWNQERCAVCRARTPMWTDIPERTDGAQVALCVACAAKTPPSMVPTKDEWFDKEISLERTTWRQ